MLIDPELNPLAKEYYEVVLPHCFSLLKSLQNKHKDITIKKEFYYHVLQDYYKLTDRIFLEQVQPRQNPLKPVCEKKCSYCCTTAVSLSAVEREAMPVFLQQNYSSGAIKHLKSKSKKIWKTASQAEIYILAGQPCPFLKKGNCSIYKYRPILCRGYNSTNVAPCKKGQMEIETIPHEFHQFIFYQIAHLALIMFYDNLEGTNYLKEEFQIKKANHDKCSDNFILTNILSTLTV